MAVACMCDRQTFVYGSLALHFASAEEDHLHPITVDSTLQSGKGCFPWIQTQAVCMLRQKLTSHIFFILIYCLVWGQLKAALLLTHVYPYRHKHISALLAYSQAKPQQATLGLLSERRDMENFKLHH